MTPTDTDLAQRYGAPAPWRRHVLAGVVGVVVLTFGGWLTWATLLQASPDVASGELTFEVLDDGTALAQFVVDLSDAEVKATCTLKAYSEDHGLVGQVAFTPVLGVGGRVEQEVATDRRATSVELVGCTAPGQNRPR